MSGTTCASKNLSIIIATIGILAVYVFASSWIVGLQEKVHSKEGINKGVKNLYPHIYDVDADVHVDADDWRLLLDVISRNDGLKWAACNSTKSSINLSNLPPIRASSLAPPPNSNILMYGTSYMGQLVSQIIAGLEVTYKNCTSNGIARDDKYNCNGIKIHTIKNSAEYQNGPKGLENLKKLLETEHFDAVFFMAPHPRCFFEYERIKELGWKNFTKYQCVNLKHFKSKKDPIRDKYLWKTVQSSPNVKRAIFVEPWDEKKNQKKNQ